MKRFKLFPCILLVMIFLLPASFLHAQLAPGDFFGFHPGTDRQLFTYEQLISYLKELDAHSDRMSMIEIGKSMQGRTMYIAFISTAENIARLDELREINRKLALDSALSENERKDLLQRGKVFVLATLSMHSAEVGPSQSAPVIAHDLTMTAEEEKLEWLRNVVYMMVPCHNPDGMNMIVNNYNKGREGKYEASSLPRVYHKYVGHNINRDFVTLSQSENQAVARIYNQDWFPQVMVEKHQMWSSGPRYFVPPFHDPIAENVDAGIWTWISLFGSNMLKDMTADSLFGVSTHYHFDDYWPGSTETCIWKNVIGMLTEAASVQTATPIYIEDNELSVSGKGLAEYEKSINFPHPWQGGWWRLSDILEYEVSSTYSMLKTAGRHKDEILAFRNEMAGKEIHKGQTKPPYFYILPPEQHDNTELVNLVNLMREHGVKVYELMEETQLDNRIVEEGAIVIPLAQPFRAFIKEVMEKQEFPVRHYTIGGPIIKPYDITSWSLPLHMGVSSWEIRQSYPELNSSLREITGDFTLRMGPSSGNMALLPASNNGSYKAAFRSLSMGIKVERTSVQTEINGQIVGPGSFVIQAGNNEELSKALDELQFEPIYPNSKPGSTEILSIPRIALIETHFHDMDAGWTRFVMDNYHIPYKVVHPGGVKETDFAEDFDVVIFPSTSKSVLMEGNPSSTGYSMVSLHPDFAKGIEKEGMKQLMEFAEGGGLIISWERSTALFEGKLSMEHGKEKEEFALPFRDISADLSKKGLYCPGSLVRIKLKKDHPLTIGMQESVGVFYRGQPVFKTAQPVFDMDRRVIGQTPDKDILISGYIEKEELLKEKPLMIWMKKGEGQFVLFGFNPNFRASTHATYKLLFNAILLKS